jgi:hypothetical protein
VIFVRIDHVLTIQDPNASATAKGGGIAFWKNCNKKYKQVKHCVASVDIKSMLNAFTLKLLSLYVRILEERKILK